jgi:hypothetical protein
LLIGNGSKFILGIGVLFQSRSADKYFGDLVGKHSNPEIVELALELISKNMWAFKRSRRGAKGP